MGGGEESPAALAGGGELRRGGRPRGDDRAAPLERGRAARAARARRLHVGARHGPRGARRGREARAGHAHLGGARRRRALPLPQAHLRRLPRGRGEDRRQGPRQGRGRRPRDDPPPARRQVAADPGGVARHRRARGGGRRSPAALSLLPRAPRAGGRRRPRRREHFQAEWKWDGIRAGGAARGGAPALVAGRGPREPGLPGRRVPARARPRVLDGELLAWDGDAPLPFHALQRRIQQERLGETARRGAGALRGLRPARGGRRGPARPAVAERRAPRRARAAGGPPTSASRRSWRRPTGRASRRCARAAIGRGGADAQAARRGLRGGPAPRGLVEVEGGPVHPRRRPRLRAARARPARVPLHRLHPRGLGRGRPGSRGQGVLGPDRRRDPARRRLRPAAHRRPLRTGAGGRAGARVRDRVRGDPAQLTAQGRLPCASRIALARDKPPAEADTLASVRALLEQHS